MTISEVTVYNNTSDKVVIIQDECIVELTTDTVELVVKATRKAVKHIEEASK